MEFLYVLEKIRVPGLNELMLLVTRFGEETAFLAIALVLFWCVDKRRGYYIMTVGFFGTMANQFLKLQCRIPRPWVLDENFTILEGARAEATGYSFPSGHTQTAVGTYGGIALTEQKHKWLKWVCIVLAVLVPFSRMYVGVHTPKDVLVAAAMALVLMFVLQPIVYREDGRGMKILLPVMIAVSICYLAFAECFPFPADMDPENLAHGRENAYTLLGALIGISVVYAVDEKKLHFKVEAVWWAQILKVVLGLILVLAVKAGLKAPLNALFGGHLIARTLRYFLVVIAAGIVWPLSFSWFGKLGKKENQK